jgi:hypothetical protein
VPFTGSPDGRNPEPRRYIHGIKVLSCSCAVLQVYLRYCTDIGQAVRHEQVGRQSGLRMAAGLREHEQCAAIRFYSISSVLSSGCTSEQTCLRRCADIGRAARHEQVGRQSGLRMASGCRLPYCLTDLPLLYRTNSSIRIAAFSIFLTGCVGLSDVRRFDSSIITRDPAILPS